MNSMLEYKGYHAAIEYDAEDDIFVGEVVGIADSLNFHGCSIDELKQTFSQCIDNYLDLCRTISKAPEKELAGDFNVEAEMPHELHKRAALEERIQKIASNQHVARDLDRPIEGPSTKGHQFEIEM